MVQLSTILSDHPRTVFQQFPEEITEIRDTFHSWICSPTLTPPPPPTDVISCWRSCSTMLGMWAAFASRTAADCLTWTPRTGPSTIAQPRQSGRSVCLRWRLPDFYLENFALCWLAVRCVLCVCISGATYRCSFSFARFCVLPVLLFGGLFCHCDNGNSIPIVFQRKLAVNRFSVLGLCGRSAFERTKSFRKAQLELNWNRCYIKLLVG